MLASHGLTPLTNEIAASVTSSLDFSQALIEAEEVHNDRLRAQMISSLQPKLSGDEIYNQQPAAYLYGRSQTFAHSKIASSLRITSSTIATILISIHDFDNWPKDILLILATYAVPDRLIVVSKTSIFILDSPLNTDRHNSDEHGHVNDNESSLSWQTLPTMAPRQSFSNVAIYNNKVYITDTQCTSVLSIDQELIWDAIDMPTLTGPLLYLLGCLLIVFHDD
jgi:hypothetical protein